MSLEDFVKSMPNNVVLRSANENKPSIFVRHPLQNSIEFDTILPDHPHPAFMHGNSADPAVLIGKYKNHFESLADVPCSLPNANPVGVGLSYNNIIERSHAFGGNVQPITIADHGLLVLIAHKNKISPHGNNNGQMACADYRSGTAWQSSSSVNIGDVRIFKGWAYECLKGHTTSSSLRPINTPGYWKRLNKVGGTPSSDSSMFTMTGSGPINWYLINDINMETDLNGGAYEIVAGLRMVDGEIQIIDPAAASDTETNLTSSSTLWKAIMPHESDTGHDLVTPGTEGTIHYTHINNKVTIVGRALESQEKADTTEYATDFKNVVIDTTTIPTVPAILYELGLAPLPNTSVEGSLVIVKSGTRYAFRGNGPDNYVRGIATLNFGYMTNPAEERTFISSRCRARVDT